MGLLDRYRANWPRVGGLLAMAGAGGVALTHRRMSKPQTLSPLKLLALFVHQYEEYADPGLLPRAVQRGPLPQRPA
jgi:hypothetical protein